MRASLLLAALGGLWLAQQADDAPPAPSLPARSPEPGYAGAESCRECHPRNFSSWHDSYHRRMTQEPDSASVLAPFEGRTPELEGIAWELEREGERFAVRPVEAGSERRGQSRRVALLTGSHHYQIYWLESPLPGVALEQLPLVWHVAERRWVPRKAMFLIPPAPTGAELDRWQAVCIKCHATGGTRYRGEEGATRVAEFGISCEACHGPGAAHVAWQRAPEASDPAREEPPEAALTHPGRLPHDRASQVCGQCHAIQPLISAAEHRTWERQGFAYRPGDDLGATRHLLRGRPADDPPELQAFLAENPEVLGELFWPDGEVRVSGREYNGLVESPCYLRGELSCLSCHELHPGADDPRPRARWADDQLRPGMDGPAACLGCHAELGDPEALRAHAHHAPGELGSDCLDCHMPYTTYGLTKAIRSHRISSPRVVAQSPNGRPNACNLCHLDRSLGWTAERLAEWYGQERPELGPDERDIAAAVRWALQGDAGQRALMAAALGRPEARATSGTGWIGPLLSTRRMDPYDAVRWSAVRTARLDPRYAGFELDFTRHVEEQRNAVRESVLSDWLRDGLSAPAERRAAVLVTPEGGLDEATFRRLYAARDLRDVVLGE